MLATLATHTSGMSAPPTVERMVTLRVARSWAALVNDRDAWTQAAPAGPLPGLRGHERLWIAGELETHREAPGRVVGEGAAQAQRAGPRQHHLGAVRQQGLLAGPAVAQPGAVAADVLGEPAAGAVLEQQVARGNARLRVEQAHGAALAAARHAGALGGAEPQRLPGVAQHQRRRLGRGRRLEGEHGAGGRGALVPLQRP